MKAKQSNKETQKQKLAELNSNIQNGAIFNEKTKTDDSECVSSTSGTILKCSLVLDLKDIKNKKIAKQLRENCQNVNGGESVIVFTYPHDVSSPIEICKDDCGKESWATLNNAVEYGVGNQHRPPNKFRVWG